MVKYNLELGKDFAIITSELKDKFPKLVDIDAKGTQLKKIAKQKAIYIYLDSKGNESKAVGKGVVKDGKIIPLHKVENLQASGVKTVPKDTIFNYSVRGMFKVLKTNLDIQPNEAITFLFAVAKGYMNTVRGFLYRKDDEYFLIKTSIATIDTLTSSLIIEKEEVKEQKQTISPQEALNILGVEA